MIRRAPAIAIGISAVAVLVGGVVAAIRHHYATGVPAGLHLVVPFESAKGLVVLPVRIGSSPRLSFILDTGAGPGIIDVERARALNLGLYGSVNVKGTGSDSAQGAFVDASATIENSGGLSTPIVIAMPLDEVSRTVGRQIDGIVGDAFLRAVTATVSYRGGTVTFDDPRGFSYHGSGAVLPLTFDSGGHPVFDAALTPRGAEPIRAKVLLDLGGNGPVTLHSPFVRAHHLPTDDASTTRAQEFMGLGGVAGGRAARLQSFSFAGLTLTDVPAVLSTATSGTYATSDVDADVGAGVISRYTVIVDFARARVILE